MAKKQQQWKKALCKLLEKENVTYSDWEKDVVSETCMDLIKNNAPEIKEIIVEIKGRVLLDKFIEDALGKKQEYVTQHNSNS